jgi:hypothetical protein
MLVVELPL